MRKSKMICGLLALSALCVGAGALNFQKPTSASAVDGFTVNRIGDLEWNAVDGATSYKVSSIYGEFTVIDNKANVGDAIERAAQTAVAQNAQATQASVEFTITPYTDSVAGTASSFTYTFEDYVNHGFTTRDISQAQKNANGTLVENGEIATPANGTAGVVGAMYKNNLFTFAWSSNGQVSSKEANNSYFYLFGSEKVVSYNGANDTYYNSTSFSEYAWAIRFTRSRYAVYLEGKEVSAKYAHTEETASYVEMGALTVPTHSSENESYAITLGVFDTYDLSGEKTGETLYIYREVIDKQNGTKTFDYQGSYFVDNNTIADPNGDGDTSDAIDENDYENCSGFGMRSPSTNFIYTAQSAKLSKDEIVEPLCEVSKKSFTDGEDKTFHWYLSNLSDLAVVNIENVKARITFNGTTVEQSLAETNVSGTYKISLTVPEEDYDKNIAISVVIKGGQVDGVRNYTAQSCLEDIMADVNAEYDINYVLPQGVVNSANNPNVYNTASAITLAAPETLPTGYLFKGWYESTDTTYQNKITEILGRVGEIELVAVIALGYNITLEIEGATQTFAYFVGDPAMQLTAPEIEGKTFVKWQIKNGAIYEDFTGMTITPTATTILKAIYDLATYQITYVAEGATHSNPATYTVGDSITFTAATKAGYFFAGWYKDSAFSQRVENTSGLSQNLTVYAWFIKDTIGATATITASENRQLVPMPVLPEGFTCATKLFIKDSTQALELEDGLYYVFNESDKVYTVEYTIMMPTGDAVVRTAELTVVAEETGNANQEPTEEKKSPWLAIGLIGGGVLLVGVALGVLFYLKSKREE